MRQSLPLPEQLKHRVLADRSELQLFRSESLDGFSDFQTVALTPLPRQYQTEFSTNPCGRTDSDDLFFHLRKTLRPI
jgi:hypothetical protein